VQILLIATCSCIIVQLFAGLISQKKIKAEAMSMVKFSSLVLKQYFTFPFKKQTETKNLPIYKLGGSLIEKILIDFFTALQAGLTCLPKSLRLG